MIKNINPIPPFNDAFSDYSMSISSNSTAASQIQIEADNRNFDSSFESSRNQHVKVINQPHLKVETNFQQFRNISHDDLKDMEEFERHISNDSNWDFVKPKLMPINHKQGSSKTASFKSKYSHANRSEKSLSIEANSCLMKKKKSRHGSINSTSLSLSTRFSKNFNNNKNIKKNFDNMNGETQDHADINEEDIMSKDGFYSSCQNILNDDSGTQALGISNNLNLNVIVNTAISSALFINSGDVKKLDNQDITKEEKNSNSSNADLLKNSSSFRSFGTLSNNECISSILSARLNHIEASPQSEESIMENKIFNDMESTKKITDNIPILSVDSEEDKPKQLNGINNSNALTIDSEEDIPNQLNRISDSNEITTKTTANDDSDINLDNLYLSEWNQFLDDQWKIKDDMLPEMLLLDQSNSLKFLPISQEDTTKQVEQDFEDCDTTTEKVKINAKTRSKEYKRKKNSKRFSSFRNIFSGYTKEGLDNNAEKEDIGKTFSHKPKKHLKKRQTSFQESGMSQCTIKDSSNYDLATCKHCGKPEVYNRRESFNKKHLYHHHHYNNKNENENDNRNGKLSVHESLQVGAECHCNKDNCKSSECEADAHSNIDQPLYQNKRLSNIYPELGKSFESLLSHEQPKLSDNDHSSKSKKSKNKEKKKYLVQENKSKRLEHENKNKIQKRKVSIIGMIMSPKKYDEYKKESKNGKQEEIDTIVKVETEYIKNNEDHPKPQEKIETENDNQENHDIRNMNLKHQILSKESQEDSEYSINGDIKNEMKIIEDYIDKEKRDGFGDEVKLIISSSSNSSRRSATSEGESIEDKEGYNEPANYQINSSNESSAVIDPKFLNDSLTVKPFPYGGDSHANSEKPNKSQFEKNHVHINNGIISDRNVKDIFNGTSAYELSTVEANRKKETQGSVCLNNMNHTMRRQIQKEPIIFLEDKISDNFRTGNEKNRIPSFSSKSFFRQNVRTPMNKA